VEGAFVDHRETVSDLACSGLQLLLERVEPTDEDRSRWARVLTLPKGDEWEEGRIRRFFEDGLDQHAYSIVEAAKRRPLKGVPQRATAIMKKLEWRRPK
jgi:hypothetical protein